MRNAQIQNLAAFSDCRFAFDKRPQTGAEPIPALCERLWPLGTAGLEHQSQSMQNACASQRQIRILALFGGEMKVAVQSHVEMEGVASRIGQQRLNGSYSTGSVVRGDPSHGFRSDLNH